MDNKANKMFFGLLLAGLAWKGRGQIIDSLLELGLAMQMEAKEKECRRQQALMMEALNNLAVPPTPPPLPDPPAVTPTFSLPPAPAEVTSIGV